jgi:hypothetical protein
MKLHVPEVTESFLAELPQESSLAGENHVPMITELRDKPQYFHLRKEQDSSDSRKQERGSSLRRPPFLTVFATAAALAIAFTVTLSLHLQTLCVGKSPLFGIASENSI